MEHTEYTTLFRIWCGHDIAYVGSTNKPFDSYIKLFLSRSPLSRKVEIERVTKVEYVELFNKADALLYELYYELLYHPQGNKGKTDAAPSLYIQDANWQEYKLPDLQSWKEGVRRKQKRYDDLTEQIDALTKELDNLRVRYVKGEISEAEKTQRFEEIFKKRLDMTIERKTW